MRKPSPAQWHPQPKRLTPRERGYGPEHRRWARQVLAASPICPCGAPATDADHIVAVRVGGDPLDLGNGIGLCRSCHSRKTAAMDGGFGNRRR